MPAAGHRLTTGELAALVGGELHGPPHHPIAGVAPLDTAGPAELAFLASPRYLPYFEASRAGAVLVTPEYRDHAAGPATRIVVDAPRDAVRRVLAWFGTGPDTAWGIHPAARVGRGARWRGRLALEAGAVLGRDVRLGADCHLGPHAQVGDGAVLGDGCRLGAHAYVAPDTVLGARVVLGPGARVGTPGFAHLEGPAGRAAVPHLGGCRLGDDVEIGANTTVDRGSVADTVIGDGTKIDNLVQVGHNVRIGTGCVIMAQAGLAGSTDIGDGAIVAGQAGLAGHLRVGAGARIAAQAGVIGDVPAGATVSGYPARDHRSVLRQQAALARLAPLTGRLERLAARDADRG